MRSWTYYVVSAIMTLGFLVIVFGTFTRLREKSLAIRGLLSIGFLALFLTLSSLIQGGFFREYMFAGIAAFTVAAIVEAWGPRKDQR